MVQSLLMPNLPILDSSTTVTRTVTIENPSCTGSSCHDPDPNPDCPNCPKHVGAIAGGVVGGIAAVVLGVIAYLLLRKPQTAGPTGRSAADIVTPLLVTDKNSPKPAYPPPGPSPAPAYNAYGGIQVVDNGPYGNNNGQFR